MAGKALLVSLEPRARKHGLTIGMCGSVLHKGVSDDDLDLIVMPLKTQEKHSWADFYKELQTLGFEKWQDRTPHHPGDTKRVLASRFDGRRVDWFLFHLDP